MGGLTLRAWRVQPGRFEVPANAGAGVDGEAEGLHAKGQRFFKGHDQAVSALALWDSIQGQDSNVSFAPATCGSTGARLARYI